jgi:hypothetical protein
MHALAVLDDAIGDLLVLLQDARFGVEHQHAMSQRSMESSLRLHAEKLHRVVNAPRFRIPAVSIKMYFCRTPSVSTSNGTSTASRVVPGIGLTMTRSDLVSALMIEDLPTFGRPTMASFNGPLRQRGRLFVRVLPRPPTDFRQPAQAPLGLRGMGTNFGLIIKTSMPSP